MERHRRELALRSELQRLLLLIPGLETEALPALMVDLEQVKAKIECIENQAIKGHTIRAGAKWETEGDRPSDFFFQKLQNKRRKQTMEGLLDDSSLLCTSVSRMKEIVVGAFKKLFHSIGPIDAWLTAWRRIAPKIVSKVSVQQRAKLDLPLSNIEIVDALRALPAGKSPSHDGFPSEFYRLFWADLSPLVLEAARDAWTTGTLGSYHNAGLICLCPKGGDL